MAYDAVRSDITVAASRKNVLPPSFGRGVKEPDQYVSCVLLNLSYFMDPKQWSWNRRGGGGVIPITHLRTYFSQISIWGVFFAVTSTH